MNADQFFEIYNKCENAKGWMSDKIMALLGTSWIAEDCPASDITFDSYDCSFELTEVRNDFRVTIEQAATLYELGFGCFWLNHYDGSETFYSKISGESRK